jgi:hypothetical protein
MAGEQRRHRAPAVAGSARARRGHARLLLARRLPAAAALAGAAFVASHPSAYTAVYWASANGDVLATLLSLGVLALAFTPRLRWLAVPGFGVALLAKESVLLLPIAWGAIAVWGPHPRMSVRELARDRVWWACVALAAIAAVSVGLGPRAPALGGEAYALSLAALPGNLLSYDGWLVDRWLATVRAFKDGVDSGVYGWGVALNVGWLAGAFVPALRRTGWIAAGLAWCAMLAPVLPLANHTYHYYLYAGLPAAGLMIASLLAAVSPRLPRVAGWALALVFAAFCAVDGHALVTKIEQAPFVVEGLRSDAIVDRARIAANAIHDLGAAGAAAAHEAQDVVAAVAGHVGGRRRPRGAGGLLRGERARGAARRPGAAGDDPDRRLGGVRARVRPSRHARVVGCLPL